MIYQNSRKLDMGDVSVLFSAMVKVNETNDECDRSLVSIGYAEGLARCKKAAQLVARHHREQGDDWDGVWWFEIFESSRRDCLAHRLFMLDICEEDDSAGWSAAIREIVLAWLALHQGDDDE